jgi:excinuclease ABC subunit C
MGDPLYIQKPIIQDVLLSMPETTGVYKYYDNTGTIIYVGKAKNLKKRVSSYFQKNHDNARLRLLVKRIVAIETISVDTEYDALLLENTLIKQHRPRYNIRLKDDKSYPWICISKDHYPRIFVGFQPDHSKNICYGPYPSHRTMYAVLDIVRNTFPLRTCKLNLSEKNIRDKKFRVCLQYHIGKCKGPCEGRIQHETYMGYINSARLIIKGELSGVIRELKKSMKDHSNATEYEHAQHLKEKIEALENYRSRSPLVHPSLKNCDVVTMIPEGEHGHICNYMRVINGSVVRAHSFEIISALDETTLAVFDHALLEVKQFLQGFSKELIVPYYPQTSFPETTFTIPKTGHKKELLVLSEKNARVFLLEKKKRERNNFELKRQNSIVEKVQEALSMSVPPVHIEAFDNSNIQGAYPVAACVVFKDGKPAPSQYRHFNIKTVEGPDDYASMEEVVYRRYKRLMDENSSLPQLILIDGGKGQLESAAESLRALGIIDKVKLISIAKKLETIYTHGDSTPLFLDKKSPVLRFFQNIRDEVHRFGITHHRKRRSMATIKTELTEMKGVGEKTATILLKHFGSVEMIKKASQKELEAVIGSVKANIVRNFLHKQ